MCPFVQPFLAQITETPSCSFQSTENAPQRGERPDDQFPYELCVVEEVTFHFEMFAAERTIDNLLGEPVNSSGRSGSHCAVNDRQRGAILLDVFNSVVNKAVVERIADVKNGAYTIGSHRSMSIPIVLCFSEISSSNGLPTSP